jgi:hypothetical protein
MDERDQVDEFTGYGLDGKAKPLSRRDVGIRAFFGLLVLIMLVIGHRDFLTQIGQGVGRFLERFAAAS